MKPDYSWLLLSTTLCTAHKRYGNKTKTMLMKPILLELSSLQLLTKLHCDLHIKGQEKRSHIVMRPI